MVALGRGLGDDGRSVVSLDPRSLTAAARATTGLDDFGDSWWQEPFARLCASLDGRGQPAPARSPPDPRRAPADPPEPPAHGRPLGPRAPGPRAGRARADRGHRPQPLGHHLLARAAGLRPRQPAAPALGAAAHRPLRRGLGRPVRRGDQVDGRDDPLVHRHARERRPPPDRVHLRLRPPVLDRHVHRDRQRARLHHLEERGRPGPDLRLAQAPPPDAAVGSRAADDAVGRQGALPSFRPAPASSRPTPTPGSSSPTATRCASSGRWPT